MEPVPVNLLDHWLAPVKVPLAVMVKASAKGLVAAMDLVRAGHLGDDGFFTKESSGTFLAYDEYFITFVTFAYQHD